MAEQLNQLGKHLQMSLHYTIIKRTVVNPVQFGFYINRFIEQPHFSAWIMILKEPNIHTEIGNSNIPHGQIYIHIHTYIIGHYNSSVRIIDLFLTPLM